MRRDDHVDDAGPVRREREVRAELVDVVQHLAEDAHDHARDERLEVEAVPSEQIFDGVLILAGGLLLLTPGLLTDLLGFSVLIPFGRQLIKDYLKAAISQRLRPGSIETNYTVH